MSTPYRTPALAAPARDDRPVLSVFPWDPRGECPVCAQLGAAMAHRDRILMRVGPDSSEMWVPFEYMLRTCARCAFAWREDLPPPTGKAATVRGVRIGPVPAALGGK